MKNKIDNTLSISTMYMYCKTLMFICKNLLEKLTQHSLCVVRLDLHRSLLFDMLI